MDIFDILPAGSEEELKKENIDLVWVRSFVESMTEKFYQNTMYQKALEERKI